MDECTTVKFDWFWTWVYPVWPIIFTQIVLTFGTVFASEWLKFRRSKKWKD